MSASELVKKKKMIDCSADVPQAAGAVLLTVEVCAQALEWDLGGQDIIDRDLEALLQGLDKINWDPTTPFFHMNLKFNRLTAAALPAVLTFLAARSSITVNVSFNQFSVAELQMALAAAGCPQWLGKRVFDEIGEINRHLSNASSLLDQQTRNFNGWTKHANTGTEQEVTTAVLQYLGRSVLLETTQIVNFDGSVLCEWDGVVLGMLNSTSVLVFVEARHCVKAEDLEPQQKPSNPPVPSLYTKLKLMQSWLSSLNEPEVKENPRRQRQLERQYDEYKRFQSLAIRGAIGGPLFDAALQNRARKLQFLRVICNDNRYAVV